MAVPRLTRRLGSRVKACGRNADGDGDGCSGRLALRRDGTVTRRRRRRRRRGRQRRTSLAASRLLAHDAHAFVSLAGKPPRTTHDDHDDLARSFKSDETHSTYSRRSFSLPPVLSMYQSLSFSCFLSLAHSVVLARRIFFHAPAARRRFPLIPLASFLAPILLPGAAPVAAISLSSLLLSRKSCARCFRNSLATYTSFGTLVISLSYTLANCPSLFPSSVRHLASLTPTRAQDRFP